MPKAPFTLGQIGHIGLAVKDPRASADWYITNLGMKMEFEYDGGIAIGSDGITLVFHKGKPSPSTIGHVSFHLPDVATLKKALAFLRKHDVDLEDPGDEIGPEAEGSPNVALWLHDPDGYRIELSVQDSAKDLSTPI